MNYLKIRQIKNLYFGYQEVAKILNITLKSAKVACARFVKNDILIRLKRNKYVLRDRWAILETEAKFILANVIQTPSYISLMTALSFYEITTQVQQNFIESIAIIRTEQIEKEGTVFKYSKINKKLYFGFNKDKGVFIASPEKAFLDALYLKSIKRYNFDITSIDFNKLDVSKIKKYIKKFPKKTQEQLNSYGYFKKA